MLNSGHRTLLPTHLKSQLYIFLTHSRLHYCILIWGVAPQNNFSNLYLMQKKSCPFCLQLILPRNVPSYFIVDRILSIPAMYSHRLSQLIFTQYTVDYQLFLSTYTKASQKYDFRRLIYTKPKNKN